MSKKDATQKGVSDDDKANSDHIKTGDDGEVIGNDNGRMEAMAEIAERARAERDGDSQSSDDIDDEDIGKTDDDGDQDDSQDAGDSDADDDQDDADDGEGGDDAGDDANANADELITLVVDGEEVQKTRAEVLEAGQRALQKESAADKRLKEATKLLREAQSHKGSPSSDADDNNDDQSLSGSPDEVDVKEIVKAIQYGTEDEAAEAIGQLMQGSGRSDATQGQAMTTDDVANIIAEKSAFDNAMTQFQKAPEDGGYGDLWDDSTLRDLVIRKEAEARDKGDARPYGELYSEIGDEVRAWRDKLAGKKTTTNLKDRDKKLEQQSDTPSGADVRKSTESKKDDQPKSRKEKLAQIAAGRGQQL